MINDRVGKARRGRQALCVLGLVLAVMPHAGMAQVYKCTVKGKTAYQSEPCATEGTALNIRSDVTEEQAVAARKRAEHERKAAGLDGDPARESAKAKARSDVNDDIMRRTQELRFEEQRKAAEDARRAEDQKLIAECEAQRGARCKDPETIKQRRIDKTPLSHEEMMANARQHRWDQDAMNQRNFRARQGF